MASKRDQIQLTPEEIAAFLGGHKTVVLGTNGPRGVPHMMPLWFVLRGEEVWAWSFTKSQKIKNLERDPRATLLFEDGVTYDKLRGVSLECDVTVDANYEVVRELGIELFTKYGDGNYPAAEVVAMIEQQAHKRSTLKFVARRTISWDHRKLGGAY